MRPRAQPRWNISQADVQWIQWERFNNNSIIKKY
jgi:hypothetical protein